MDFKPLCTWEGPRGGECSRAGKWMYRAGTYETAHIMGWSCDQHLEELVKEGRGLDVGEPMVKLGRDGEERPARDVLAEMRESEPSLFGEDFGKRVSTHTTGPSTKVRTGGYL